MRDRRRCGRGPRHLDPHRVVQELLADPSDLGRHRRREEKSLPGEGNKLADPLDVRDETHVEHAVGLVDDEQLDAGQQQLAALDMVEQAAGRRDQHVDAAGDLGILVAEGDAADQQCDRKLLVDAVAGEIFLDLRGELARRLQDQRARHPGTGAAGFQDGQHRQGEGRGLAGACLGDAEHVLAGEHVGDSLGLDGGRRRVAGGRDRRKNLIAQAEFGKRHRWLRFSRVGDTWRDDRSTATVARLCWVARLRTPVQCRKNRAKSTF